jgi:hypothetical protein
LRQGFIFKAPKDKPGLYLPADEPAGRDRYTDGHQFNILSSKCGQNLFNVFSKGDPMNPATLRILFILFLAAHGWIHMSLAQVPVPQPGALRTPFFPAWWRDSVDPAWPASKLGLPSQVSRTLGWVLWVLVTGGFVLAAAALLFAPGQPALWQGFTAGASLLSIVLLALYWHPWLPVGVLIDLALLAVIYLRWPVIQFS